MESGPATSWAPPTAVPPDLTSRADVRGRTAGNDRSASAVYAGQEWTFRRGFDRVLQLTAPTAWQQPHAQGWQLVKHNSRREVWRARLAGSVYYLKYYLHEGGAAAVRRLLGRSACRREWQCAMYALRAGIAVVAPVAHTADLLRSGRRCCLLVTEAVEPACSLDEFWQRSATEPDPRRRRWDASQMIELLAEMIARAHQAGFEHLDMHAANILVQAIAPGRYRTVLVDLQCARLGVPISDRAVVRNLAQLNQWFRRHSNITERLRFLRAYLRWRNEYEAAFEYGRPLRMNFRQLAHALVRAASRHARRLWARRDRRAQRDGRYFARLRLSGGWRGLAVVQSKHASDESRASRLVTTRDWWTSELRDPLRWFASRSDRPTKDSHSACVRRALLSHPDGPLPVFVKRPLARNRRRWFSQLWPPSRSMQGWRRGHALLHRNLPVARPLAVLERRWGPLVLDSLIVTEALPGAVDLDAHIRSRFAKSSAQEWHRHKRELLPLLARLLRGLSDCGFVHRDCKAGNILVLALPRPKLFWIDMDGVRVSARWRRRSRQRLAALARLHVSLANAPGLTRTDRIRFLRDYCTRWGSPPNAWRSAWRDLEPLVANIARAHEAHRRWKLARYGRE